MGRLFEHVFQGNTKLYPERVWMLVPTQKPPSYCIPPLPHDTQGIPPLAMRSSSFRSHSSLQSWGVQGILYTLRWTTDLGPCVNPSNSAFCTLLITPTKVCHEVLMLYKVQNGTPSLVFRSQIDASRRKMGSQPNTTEQVKTLIRWCFPVLYKRSGICRSPKFLGFPCELNCKLGISLIFQIIENSCPIIPSALFRSRGQACCCTKTLWTIAPGNLRQQNSQHQGIKGCDPCRAAALRAEPSHHKPPLQQCQDFRQPSSTAKGKPSEIVEITPKYT